ncbi:MAG: hypothetical protein J0L97_02710 [Alphaproteobacteria bacterium]|nr:hypothetical protein [Alphaproteobacteria bacterium]
MLRLWTTLLLTLMLGGCTMYPLPLYWNKPEGPPEFRQGYWDGCDTGMASGSSSYASKIFFRYKKDPNFLDNPLYNKGWTEGITYCRFYIGTLEKDEWKEGVLPRIY